MTFDKFVKRKIQYSSLQKEKWDGEDGLSDPGSPLQSDVSIIPIGEPLLILQKAEKLKKKKIPI